MKTNLNVRVEEDLLKVLDRVAKDMGLTRSSYVNMVLTKSIKEKSN